MPKRIWLQVDLGNFEVQKFDEAELEFLFDEQYGKFSKDELCREANDLMRKTKSERLDAERKELEEKIREAEEKGDEQLESELMQKLSRILRQK